jgi:hypothetical protein
MQTRLSNFGGKSTVPFYVTRRRYFVRVLIWGLSRNRVTAPRKIRPTTKTILFEEKRGDPSHYHPSPVTERVAKLVLRPNSCNQSTVSPTELTLFFGAFLNAAQPPSPQSLRLTSVSAAQSKRTRGAALHVYLLPTQRRRPGLPPSSGPRRAAGVDARFPYRRAYRRIPSAI